MVVSTQIIIIHFQALVVAISLDIYHLLLARQDNEMDPPNITVTCLEAGWVHVDL